MKELLEAYQVVARSLELPSMEIGGSEIQRQDFTDAESVWSAIQAAGAKEGWLQFQSQQIPFQGGLPEPEAAWGLLLSAEAVTVEGDSLALNPNGAGGWRLARFHHREVGELLHDVVVQLAHDRALGKLRYRRYWRRDATQGCVQSHACFIGFDKE